MKTADIGWLSGAVATMALAVGACGGGQNASLDHKSVSTSPAATPTPSSIALQPLTVVAKCEMRWNDTPTQLSVDQLAVGDASKVPTRLAPYLAVWEGVSRPRVPFAPAEPVLFVVHSISGTKAKATLVVGDVMVSDGDDWEYVSGTGLHWRNELMMGDGVAMRLETTMSLTPDGKLRAQFVQLYDGLSAEGFPAVTLLERCVSDRPAGLAAGPNSPR